MNDIEINFRASDDDMASLIAGLLQAVSAVLETGETTTFTVDGEPVAELRPVSADHAEHTAGGPIGCTRCRLLKNNQYWMALPDQERS